MDFINSLLSALVAGITALFIALATLLTSSSQTQEPITIAPKVSERATEILPSTPASQTTQAPVVSETPKGGEPLLDVNGLARSAVVNLFCIGNNKVHSASGSGIVIDSRGVILTNAHVAQIFLLRDYPSTDAVKCTVRTGSPARSAYYADVLYLPPTWVTQNSKKITEESATGTGEHDYAFLLITKTYDGSSVPDYIPAIQYTVEEPSSGDPMLLAAYPSAFLSNRAIVNNLQVSSTFTIVKKLYSFNPPHTIDLFSIGSTSISQSGASGGSAVRASDGKVMGIITVSTEAEVVEDRDLRALTLAHVNRSLQGHGIGSINELLSGDLDAKASQFEATTAAALRAALIDAIEN